MNSYTKYKSGKWKFLLASEIKGLCILKSDSNPLLKLIKDTTKVQASDYANVLKGKLTFNNLTKDVYFKEYKYRNTLDILKHLFRKSRAQRAFQAEQMLTANGFNTANTLAIGQKKAFTLNTEICILTDAINGKSVYEIIESLTDFNARKQFTVALGTEIGKLHAKGICHGDLRVGNILCELKNNKWIFHLIDNERTKKFNKLPYQLRLKNIVQVNMLLKDSASLRDRSRFYNAYLNENPQVQKKQFLADVLNRTITRMNKLLAQNRIKPSNIPFRSYFKLNIPNTKQIEQHKLSLKKYVISKDYSNLISKSDIEMIPEYVKEAKCLKNDKKASIFLCEINNNKYIVKRYNYTNLQHAITNTLQGSRAVKSYNNGLTLKKVGIDTPAPIAYSIYKRHTLIHTSYIINEYIDGNAFRDLWNAGELSSEQIQNYIQLFRQWIHIFKENKIYHGDLKHSNILISKNRTVLIDLDSMAVFKNRFIFYIKHRKDTSTFENRLSKKPTYRI